ncbi:MAG: sugar nucleotide-binding protein, partial [Chloroflexota bacterium]
SPTYTHDLAAATRALMERDAAGLFNLTSGGECSWHEFASATLELAGIDVEIEPTATVQQPGKAVRPSYSAMDSVRLADYGVAPLRPWREALGHYLEAKGIIGA